MAEQVGWKTGMWNFHSAAHTSTKPCLVSNFFTNPKPRQASLKGLLRFTNRRMSLGGCQKKERSGRASRNWEQIYAGLGHCRSWTGLQPPSPPLPSLKQHGMSKVDELSVSQERWEDEWPRSTLDMPHPSRTRLGSGDWSPVWVMEPGMGSPHKKLGCC